MASFEGSQPETEHQSQSLDRATFGTYHLTPTQGDLPDEPLCNSIGTKQPSVEVERESRLRQFSQKLKGVKHNANNIIHHSIRNTSRSPAVPTASTLAPLPAEEAEDDRLFYDAPEQEGPNFKEVLKNPVSTVQSALHGASGAKFAETMDNQVIAHGAEVRIVRAYDKVLGATSKEAHVKAVDNLEDLKKARQDAFLFRYYLEHYGDQYIDANPNLPTPSEEALNTSVQRLLMTSTPYQMLFMQARRIYRWDNPSMTAKYLAAYVLLWALNYLSGAAILTVIWLVFKRRIYPPTLEDTREEIKRSENVEATALNITQLIEQHGSHGWTDALRQDLGPWLLLQLEDLANVLEIWRNFYEWRDPDRTKATLAILIALWLTITIVPVHLLIKVAQFNMGCVFFGLFPIATRYPKYRLLASPMKWLFWKVPTDAEWAIARLQVEARHRTEALRKEDLDSKQRPQQNESFTADLGRYACSSGNHHGNLHVSAEGVQYISAGRKKLLWEIRFENVKLIQKIGAGDGLVLVHNTDEVFRVSGLKLRNEVFTQIVGYSGLRWQVSG
ncbi:MAG: hypothetical protein Q9174_003920 [Haloplaca sp. 1 TL-2023]